MTTADNFTTSSDKTSSRPDSRRGSGRKDDDDNKGERDDANKYAPPEGVAKELQINIAGKLVKFEVIADWIVTRHSEKPVAEVFYVSYRVLSIDDQTFKVNGGGAVGEAQRPITFLFNGGPGASSVYLHIGAVGPYRVKFTDQGRLPHLPPQLVPNDESWLLWSDLVFIDPVGTGFSRPLSESRNELEPFRHERNDAEDLKKREEEATEELFAVDRDIEILSEFITRYLSTHKRWGASIVLAGESYGGFRVGRMARSLQEDAGILLSSAIAISPALDFAALSPDDYDVVSWVDLFPSYVMASAFWGRSKKAKSLSEIEIIETAERFATERLPSLLLGGMPSQTIFDEYSELTGIPAPVATLARGRIDPYLYCRELLKDERKWCGLYDASYALTDPYPDRPYYEGPDPTSATLDGVFTGGINYLLRVLIGIETDRSYLVISNDVFLKFKRNDPRHAWVSKLEAMDDLRYGLSLNPYLKVCITHGYYDLVTPYFSSKRLLMQSPLTDEQRNRVICDNYQGGHMFYTWEQSRKRFSERVKQL
jgi:carboxypeptidase C (cathepsin A)